MSGLLRGHQGSLPAAIRRRLETTASVSAGVFRRRDSGGVFVGVLFAYLVVFLWALQDLTIRTDAGIGVVTVVSDPLSRMLESTGPYTYEPVALVELGVASLEFSPLNVALGSLVAGLVGLNLAMTYLAWTQPKSCGVGATSGLVASIPALLAGSACCAPVVLVVVGIQASALLLSVFAIMLPMSIVLLLGSLVYVADMVDPTAV